MATASETVPGAGAAGEAAADAAERLAKAAGEAADAAGEAIGIESEGHSSQGDAWSFWFRALMTVVVVIICYAATKVIRGESSEQRRLRLRAERRAKKKAERTGPDEIDQLLNSIIRRKPGQAAPMGAVPLGPGRGPGAGRGAPQGAGAGRGSGAATAAAAARMAAVGRGNGVARGQPPPPPPGADNRPKLRWDQTNEEVEIIIRVDPKVARGDVHVEITTTMLKLSLRNQTVIAGHLYKSVDPEGSTWVIDDPGPGYSKEVTITLLKAEVATSREGWWRAPLKGLENRGPPGQPVRRQPSQPADPEMVRKAIEAIRAKSGAGAKPGVKLGAKTAMGQAATEAAPNAANAGGGPSAGVAAAPSIAAASANAAVGSGDGASAVSGNASPNAQPAGKAGKSGGKKKNRKKK